MENPCRKLKRPNEARQGCPVLAYADAVVAGQRAANKWIRLACERHINDLQNAHERGLWWDQEAADHAIEFFKLLKHSKGEWVGQSFELTDWQSFIVGQIIGWKRWNGYRRFRTAFIEVPRKNGKTTLAAGLGLYLFVCDGEAGAEIYSAATKRDQAKLVFEEAKMMVSRCSGLANHIERFRYHMAIPELRSKFEPLGADGDTLDGLNPFVAICDEIHAWKSRDLWDVLETGMGARRQPLMLAITTAGDFSESIYNTMHNYTEQVLDGVITDDAMFGYIACIDADDEWTDPKCWAKANPNLGYSLTFDGLKEKIQRSLNEPSSQNKIKRNHLGLRTSALDAWIRLDQWDKVTESFSPEMVVGQQCYGGLDLANSSDLAAFVLVFPFDTRKGQPVYRVVPHFWCPSEGDTKADRDLRKKLFPWVKAGFITFTEGNVIDLQTIQDHINELTKKYSIQAICYDPWNAEKTAQDLTLNGLNMVKFPQNMGNFNEPSKAFERAVLDKRFLHNGNPVLRWMASNCVTVTNGAGLIMPSRKNSREKIDGVVASIMAVGCHMRFAADGPSVYEERGFDS